MKRIGASLMKKNLGLILLAIWLILTGLQAFVRINIPELRTLMSLLAIAAGAMILLGR